LEKRPNVHRHLHVRAGNRSDLGRLARFLSGNTVGLVLAGGGARGIAHVGVFRALQEAGVPVDVFGGTSIGSVLGACMASDWGWEKVYHENKREFLSNPTSDFNFIPLVSLLAGRKLDRILARSFANRPIEELWFPFLCVSSNYTQACEQVHPHGELKRALRASMAIPGVFPPVVHGNDLLVDGGVFNNMPVDIMARMGVRTIMAVDLRPDDKLRRALNFTEFPSSWALLADRFRPKERRRYQVPSMLTTLMAANTLNSQQKMSQVVADVDLLFHPDVRRFGLLEWKSYDLLVEQGYRHAQEVLERNPWPFQPAAGAGIFGVNAAERPSTASRLS
jgi:NTE family protein